MKLKDQHARLLEQVVLPNGVRLKNRIVMAPMSHVSSCKDGSVSEAELAYYACRAGGVGMVVTAGASVTAGGGFPCCAKAEHDDRVPGLARLAEAIQERGAKAVLQLAHAGRYALPEEGECVSASAVPAEKEGAPLPWALSEEEIAGVIGAFGQAARRAAQAGFDGVEIHGANGFLVQQFFSPHSNRRTDRYGGSLKNRMTFALELIDEVKRAAAAASARPFIVGFRLSPEEIETPGITLADTLELAEALADKGLDYLHVSMNDYWSPPSRGVVSSRPGIELLQERVGRKVPLIGCGGIRSADEAAKALKTGVPLLALGRALLAEPEWVEKLAAGREKDIHAALSRDDQGRLAIPGPLWAMILDSPGKFKLEAASSKRSI